MLLYPFYVYISDTFCLFSVFYTSLTTMALNTTYMQMELQEYNFSGGFRIFRAFKINVIKEALCNDIEILAETWGCNCNVTYEGYTPVVANSQKRNRFTTGTKSGGFLILLKNDLSKNFKILKTSNTFIWIEIDKSMTKTL